MLATAAVFLPEDARTHARTLSIARSLGRSPFSLVAGHTLTSLAARYSQSRADPRRRCRWRCKTAASVLQREAGCHGATQRYADRPTQRFTNARAHARCAWALLTSVPHTAALSNAQRFMDADSGLTAPAVAATPTAPWPRPGGVDASFRKRLLDINTPALADANKEGVWRCVCARARARARTCVCICSHHLPASLPCCLAACLPACRACARVGMRACSRCARSCARGQGCGSWTTGCVILTTAR